MAARRAFSLLEVILALAILAGAVAVLSEVASSGLRQARITQDLTRAQFLCESKLAEISAGLVPAESHAEAHFEAEEAADASEWLYTIRVTSAGETDLLAVAVTVRHERTDRRLPVEFSLVRWMVDPEAETPASSSSSSDSSSNSSSSGSSGTGTSATGAGT